MSVCFTYGRRFVVLGAMLATASSGSTTNAAFTRVIHSPPDSLEQLYRIEPGTQVNLFPGAVTNRYFEVRDASPWGPSPEPIEINVLGGTIRRDVWAPFRTAGSGATLSNNVTVNISSGVIESGLVATNAALVRMSGGSIQGDLEVTKGAFAVLAGGDIQGDLRVADGSLVTMTGGSVNRSHDPRYSNASEIRQGSVFQMSGGVLGNIQSGGALSIYEGSTATFSGGRIAGRVYVGGGSTATVSGGAQGTFWVTAKLDLVGGDFRLNGTAISGLTTPGARVSVDIPQGGVLTGTLADGTPLTLAPLDPFVFGDFIAPGCLTLIAAPVPTTMATTFNAPVDEVPLGLRAGQRLRVGTGGVVPSYFDAGRGSVVHVDGGDVEPFFNAAGATVDISAGHVGGGFRALEGTVVKLSGGSIGSEFELRGGSALDMTGGALEQSVWVQAGCTVRISGGVVGDSLLALPGSSVTMVGGEFRINGIPVSGVGSAGELRQIDLLNGEVLSGTLADGRSFVMENDGSIKFPSIADGTLALQNAPLPAAGPTLIHVPIDPAPVGLREGQTLVLSDGGAIGDQFTAGWGSVVRMTGGEIGRGFRAVGSFVNISGGGIGHGMQALYGSVVNISGGVVREVSGSAGSVVNITGGEVVGANPAGGIMRIKSGSVVQYASVYGGTLDITGGIIGNGLDVSNDGQLTVSGGAIGGDVSLSNATATLSGGSFGDGFQTGKPSQVTIVGGNLRLNGTPIPNSPSTGGSAAIDLQPGDVLSGEFPTGPFAFAADDGDVFAPGTLVVRSVQIVPPSAPNAIEFPGGEGWGLRGARAGQVVTVRPGGSLVDNFVAGPGSTIAIRGGTVGANFEAVDARVTIADGVVGGGFDALRGSTVDVTGGTIGADFEAHAGSIVNISGGLINGFVARSGSVVTISGGDFAQEYDGIRYDHGIAAEPGSEVHLVGTDFQFNGRPIVGLEPGGTVTLPIGALPFSAQIAGTLADGSKFLTSMGAASRYYVFDYANWRWNAAPPTITVTMLLTADFDGSGLVDAADGSHWRNAFGGSGMADANRDGVTNGNDFLAWQHQLGRRAAPVNVVPEPPSAMLVLAMALGVMVLVRRRRRSADLAVWSSPMGAPG